MRFSKKNNYAFLSIITIALAASLALPGCGGGGDSKEEPAVNASLQAEIPLAVGDRWLYTLAGGYRHGVVNDNGEQLVRVTDSTTTGSVTTAQLDTLLPHNLDLLERHHLRATATALEEHFPDSVGPYGQPVSSLTMLQFPLVAGESFVVYDWSGLDIGYDYDGDGTSESVDEKRTVTVIGIDGISTALGNFPQAWKTSSLIETRMQYSTGAHSEITYRIDEWLVSGIGVIRRNKRLTYPSASSYDHIEEIQLDLTRFNVNGRRSEQQAPRALADTRQPAPGSSTNDGWTAITLSFDETIDVSAITNDSLTVVNTSGTLMPGKIRYTDRKLTFYPSLALPNGHYTVHVRNVPDVIGNMLDHSEWSFYVDTSRPTDSQSLVPLSIGDRWIYDVTTQENYNTPVTATRMETVISSATIQGNSGVKIQQRNPIDNTLLNEYYLQKSASSLSQLFPVGSAPYGQDIASLTLMHLPIYGGSYENAHWRDLDSGHDYDGDGVNDRLDITITTTIGSETEYVTVPVGSWPNAVLVTSEQLNIVTGSSTGATAEARQTVIEWLVPNIGVVQRNTVVSTMNYQHTTIDKLTAYRVGNTRSESTVPSVSEYTPSSQGTRTAPTHVSARFSEPLDLGSLPVNAMTLTNSAGETVAGTLSISSQQLLFTPAHALPDDRYTATLSNIPDLLGNTLAAPSWAFTVDTVRPIVRSSSIANGAINVATGSSITFNFSEPVLAGYFSSPLITLKTAAGADHNYLIQQNGNILTVVPNLLEHSTTYTLTLTNQIQDSYGNTLATPYSITFTTPPAVLKTPAYHLHVLNSSTSRNTFAIGDVNDDGRNDLVVATGMTTILSEIDSFTLHIFLQQADGSLAMPLKTKTFDSPGYGKTCIPSGVHIGDVTGDGKTDIILGEAWCGIKIFERAADGSWPRPEPITTNNISNMQYIDMNGDGRKDVVGFNPNNSNMISIWYQQADGGLSAEMSTEVSAIYGTVIHLHDMNGDGLTDIVVALGTSGDRQLGIMTQRNDHSFKQPVYYSGGSGSFYWETIISDLNNDGRPDIIGRVRNSTLGEKLAVLYQKPDGKLQLPTYYNMDLYANTLFVGDVNNDGRNDVLVGTGNRIGVYLQNSSGLLKEVDEYAGSNILAIGDMNNDNKDDVVTMLYHNMRIHYNIAP